MKKFFAAAATLGLYLGMSASGMAAPSVYPTGTTIYDPAQAQNGYVLISVDYKDVYARVDNREYMTGEVDFNSPGAVPRGENSDLVFLMDMNGNVVNTWKDLGDNKKCYLLPDGHLLSISETRSEVTEYDWDGKVVWNFATKLGPHHDGRRLANGNTLILCYETVPASVIRNVENQTTQWWGTQDRANAKLRGDTIIEVNPEGKIVWSWSASEHLDINRYMPLTGMNDWTHGNTVSVIPPNKWYDAGDKRFKPGNIMYNPRHFDEFVIIDRESGDVVWSLKGFKAMGGLGQCHEPIMIEKGKPGAGNIIFFDNGLFPKTRDRVGLTLLGELNPVTGELEWQYESQGYSNMHFFSKTMGSESRLPNGNTFISEDNTGRLFEVTRDLKHPEGGEIVWEYMMPTYSQRSRIYQADFCPQLKAVKRVTEPFAVIPPDNADFHIAPTIRK